jgi:diacylglycerol kinase
MSKEEAKEEEEEVITLAPVSLLLKGKNYGYQMKDVGSKNTLLFSIFVLFYWNLLFVYVLLM